MTRLQVLWAWVVVMGVVMGVAAKPIVDPGLFVIQGVRTCINGTGYCLLGNNCSLDVDFLPDETGGHCYGLRDAFTPNIDFVCCRYNPLGKATSKLPTTTLSSFTITDVFSLVDDEAVLQQQQDEIDYDNLNPENLIDIVGVVTDLTGILGLVTRPWTGTLPTRAPTPTTTTHAHGTDTHTQTEQPDNDQVSTATDSYHELPSELQEPSVVDQDGSHITVADATTITHTTSQLPTVTTQSTTASQMPTLTTSSQMPTLTTSSQMPTLTTQLPPPPTHNHPDNMNVIFLPHFPFLDKLSVGGKTTAAENVTEALTELVLSDGTPRPPSLDITDDMNAIVFPQESFKNDSTVVGETQALEEVAEIMVPAGDSETDEGGDTTQVTESKDGESTPSVSQAHDAGQIIDDSVGETASESEGKVPEVVGVGGEVLEVVGVGEDMPDVVGGEGAVVSDDAEYDYYSHFPDHHLLQPVNQNICGFKGLRNYDPQPSSSRILGGLVATTVEWCWVAAIMERRQGGHKYVCSGALVEANLVISTATCLRRLDTRHLSRYLVVLGDSNLREDLPYGIQFHSLAEVDTHPDYLTSGGAHANDIGVVRLQGQATLSDNVCLVCMAQQDAVFPSHTCTVTGYGVGHIPLNMITDVRDVVPSDGVLRQLSVPLLKKGECRTALQNITGSAILATSDSFLCAGGLHQSSACYSTLDGGSPLACEAGGRWFVAGLVSWSKDCTQPGTPNVYTRVSSYTSWLQATYLRMLGFLTPTTFSSKQRWMHQHLHNINKEFA